MINSRELVRKNYKCENCLNTETKLINPIEVNLICNECGGILSEINNSEIKFLKKKKKPSDNNNLNESKKKDRKKSKDKTTKNERKTINSIIFLLVCFILWIYISNNIFKSF